MLRGHFLFGLANNDVQEKIILNDSLTLSVTTATNPGTLRQPSDRKPDR